MSCLVRWTCFWICFFVPYPTVFRNHFWRCSEDHKMYWWLSWISNMKGKNSSGCCTVAQALGFAFINKNIWELLTIGDWFEAHNLCHLWLVYSWHCAWGSLLVGLKEPYGMPGIKPRASVWKANYVPSLLSLWFQHIFGRLGWDNPAVLSSVFVSGPWWCSRD